MFERKNVVNKNMGKLIEGTETNCGIFFQNTYSQKSNCIIIIINYNYARNFTENVILLPSLRYFDRKQTSIFRRFIHLNFIIN